MKTQAPAKRMRIPRIKRKFAFVPLRIKDSPLQGFGLFAAAAIPRGTKVIEYSGTRIPRAEAIAGGPFWDRYKVTVSRRWAIDGGKGGSGAQFINHSCRPNLRPQITRGHVFFFSVRNIQAGEELTFRYAYPSKLRRLPCRCGAANCRRFVRVFLV
jgi:SET domain-containing protein